MIELASLKDWRLVAAHIAHSLGLSENGREITAHLCSYLQQRHVLLMLDNLEHLPEAVALIRTLLATAAGLTIVATSREALHLYGEYEFPVAPLALPDLAQLPALDSLAQYAALQLFIARAQAVQPVGAYTLQAWA